MRFIVRASSSYDDWDLEADSADQAIVVVTSWLEEERLPLPEKLWAVHIG